MHIILLLAIGVISIASGFSDLIRISERPATYVELMVALGHIAHGIHCIVSATRL